MSSEFSIEHCDFPWTSSMISLDKTMRCCCAMTLPVGNIDKEAPEEIWNNLTMQSLRQSMSQGVLHSVCIGASCRFVQGRNPLKNSLSPNYSENGFDESWYVKNYQDVSEGLGRQRWASGLEHYLRYGHQEYRYKNSQEAQLASEELKSVNSAEKLEDFASSIEIINSNETVSHTSHLVFHFKAKNLGSVTWIPNTEILPNQPSIRFAAALYNSFADLSDFRFAREYRSYLKNTICTKQEEDFQLTIDCNNLVEGESILLVDVVNELNFWFSELGSKPLIILFNKDLKTNQISWTCRNLNRDPIVVKKGFWNEILQKFNVL